MFEQFTLGIEEEFQIVDPETRELRSHVSEILEEGKAFARREDQAGNDPVDDRRSAPVFAQTSRRLGKISRPFGASFSGLAKKKGMAIVAASTHPFSKWSEQEIYDGDRYKLLVDELQMVARSLLIFGVHVHVGVPDLDRRIHIMNAARYFLPHVLALTTSSPFWLGFNTGLKSYRSEVFKKFPRTDIPDHFESYQQFQSYVDLLVKMNCIEDGTKIWWDVRPHSKFPTLEFRICDIPTRVEDTVAVAALFQAIVAKLNSLIDKNLGFRLYHRRLIQENKWRAIRYGLDGKLLDLGKQKEVPVQDLIRELLDFVDEVVEPLGSRREMDHIHHMLERGTSADEQLRVYEETGGDFNAVVDMLMANTLENVPEHCFA
jgi:carboxylate-amine ligase